VQPFLSLTHVNFHGGLSLLRYTGGGYHRHLQGIRLQSREAREQGASLLFQQS
jgi:hypothetical protein